MVPQPLGICHPHTLQQNEWISQCYEGWLASQGQGRCQGELAGRFQRNQPSGKVIPFEVGPLTLTCAGQAGWMGKGSNGESADKDKSEHVSQPISSLKDPSSFGPPPRHVNYHGAAAVPNQTTPDRRGIGAPLSQDQTTNQSTHYQQEEAEEEEPQRPAPPPVPYRANTTGLSTDHLPPPPRRTDSASPASTNSFNKPKPPKPPPRLPLEMALPATIRPLRTPPGR